MEIVDFVKLDEDKQLEHLLTLGQDERTTYLADLKKKNKMLSLRLSGAIQSKKNIEHKKEEDALIAPEDRIATNLIQPHPNQPRKDLSEDKVARMGISLRERGHLQPIRVHKDKDGNITLIAGQVRLAGHRLNEKEDLEGGFEDSEFSHINVVYEKKENYTKLDFLLDALTENNRRNKMTVMDNAVSHIEAFEEAKIENPNLSVRKFADMTGMESHGTISKYQAIVDQSDELKAHIKQSGLDKLNMIYQIVKLEATDEEKMNLVDRAVKGEIKTKDLEDKNIPTEKTSAVEDNNSSDSKPSYSLSSSSKKKYNSIGKLVRDIKKAESKDEIVSKSKEIVDFLSELEDELGVDILLSIKKDDKK